MTRYLPILLLLTACATPHAHVTAPSTASVRSSVAQAQTASQQAQAASLRSSGHIKVIRDDADKIIIGTESVQDNAQRIRDILNGKGHP